MKKPDMAGNRPRPVAAATPAADAALFPEINTSARTPVSTSVHSDERERHTRVIATISHAPDTFEMLFRYNQNKGVEMSETIALALREYFADKPEARQAMPDWAEAKLEDKLFKVKK